jgi:hypothetical protein
MTITLKQLAAATAGTAAAAVYTASDVNTQIDACAITNNSTDTVATISLWITGGGSPGDQNVILKNFSIPVGSTKKSYEVAGQVVPAGASLYAKASAAGVLTLVCSGREQTVA